MKSRVSGFSRAKLEAGKNVLGLCTARDESKSCCCVFRRVRRRGSREISLASSLLRASTDALISYWTGKNKTLLLAKPDMQQKKL